jgi:hypothetical protein
MNGFASPGRKWLGVPLMAALALVGSCNPVTVNLLQGVSLAEGSGVLVGVRKMFVLEGKGTCQSVTVDWGDGTRQANFVPVAGRRIEFETSASETRTLSHTWSGWGGGKTVTVEGHGCEGKVRIRFNASPSQKRLGWNATAPAGTTGVCQTVATLPGMIPRMLVRIQLTTLAAVRDIDFGCFAGGCVYNADGKPGSVAGPGFPFPGLREYSAIFRIGTQVVQGGTNTTFTTTATGPLEFCLNDGDNDLTNNRGGFDVVISVDELGPP